MNPASQSEPVHLIVGNVSSHSGISRYARELYRELNGRMRADLCSFRVPPLARRLSFLEHVPLGVAPDHRRGVYHFTRIMGCSLMLWRPVHPAVATVHDMGHLVWPVERPKRILDRLLLRLSLLGLCRVDRIIAVSHATGRSLSERLGIEQERIQVIYEGVDRDEFRPLPEARQLLQERFQLGQRSGAFDLLYVGNEFPRKNLKTLLEALAILKRDRIPFRLIKVGSAGSQECRSAFLRQVSDVDLIDSVLIVGEVDEANLPLFYNAADLLVLPSHIEGFGLPVLEAMACGTPVVCSDAGALPEVVGDAGLLASPYDARGLAEAMEGVLRDTNLRRTLIEKGLRRSQYFSWRKATEATVAVYNELLAGAKIGRESGVYPAIRGD
jgi:glycosyltransferase involved in cell wall biosynthesis